jgi:hypothetical protein
MLPEVEGLAIASVGSAAPSGETSRARSRGGENREGFVFISSKREELQSAKAIRDALLAAHFRVWWDEDIQTG